MPINEPETDASPPSTITEAPNTDVPVMAPPDIIKIVVIFDFTLNPIPSDAKNNAIEDAPNIMPLAAALKGKNPVLPCPTAASAIYVNNRIIATMEVTSATFCLLLFV